MRDSDPVSTKPFTIIDIARDMVYGEKQFEYGPPEESYTRIAKMWSIVLEKELSGCEIPPEKVGLMMIAFKLCREINRHKEDNLIDIIGYADTTQRVVEALKCPPLGPFQVQESPMPSPGVYPRGGKI